MSETNEAAVQRVTRKLLQRADDLLDVEALSPQDLGKLADVLTDAARVLGVKTALDAEEQRAKIAVLVARAGGDGEGDRDMHLTFSPAVWDASS